MKKDASNSMKDFVASDEIFPNGEVQAQIGGGMSFEEMRRLYMQQYFKSRNRYGKR